MSAFQTYLVGLGVAHYFNGTLARIHIAVQSARRILGQLVSFTSFPNVRFRCSRLIHYLHGAAL
jgi:hypothetical protein